MTTDAVYDDALDDAYRTVIDAIERYGNAAVAGYIGSTTTPCLPDGLDWLDIMRVAVAALKWSESLIRNHKPADDNDAQSVRWSEVSDEAQRLWQWAYSHHGHESEGRDIHKRDHDHCWDEFRRQDDVVTLPDGVTKDDLRRILPNALTVYQEVHMKARLDRDDVARDGAELRLRQIGQILDVIDHGPGREGS